MSDHEQSDPASADSLPFPLSLGDIAERAQRLVVDWMMRNGSAAPYPAVGDPMDICATFLEMIARMATSPRRIVDAHVSLWADYVNLWQNTTAKLFGLPIQSVFEPEETDGRFADHTWQDIEIFNFIKQSYLLTARWLMRTVRNVDGIDYKTRHKLEFYTRQFINAMSPSNFALTNPEVIRATIESGGENLLFGLKNLLEDLETGTGAASAAVGNRVTAFFLGETLAATPGKVIHRNEMVEIIQYAPTTDRVLRRPLLFVPAWVNRYYLFDLRPENSWVRWALDQGHTVFMLSWVNPNHDLGQRSFEDYLLQGPLEALDVIERATGEREVNAIGYCIGGTLLAAGLAVLASKGDDRVKSATLLATMLDYSEPGDLGAFIDEATISYLDEQAASVGTLDPAKVSMLFNMLREHDLIWSFVVNTYLLGKDTFPSDLFFWNADTTRMPSAMHSYYLRNFHKNNALATPGGITLAGEAVDLRKVAIPTYFLAAREDHIAPWKSCYKGSQIFAGESCFTLTASGHVAGVLNPPVDQRYCYWTNSKTPPIADQWLAGSHRVQGSWWPHWDAWIKAASTEDWVPARSPGGARVKPLGDAPGRYVMARS